MTPDEFKKILKDWDINAAIAAKVLCIHSNKMSEYLDGITRIPCSVALHLDALQHLDEDTRNTLIEQRLQRKAHQ